MWLDAIENNDFVAFYHKIDWGLNFGIGYEIENILISFGYSFGLVNVTADYNTSLPDINRDLTLGYVVKNKVYTVALAYFFDFYK